MTIEQLAQQSYPLPAKKEIIGWRFKDYELVCKTFNGDYFASKFEVGSQRHKDLIQLGALEILCTPVYKEVEVPPKGTVVIDEDGVICISKGVLENGALRVNQNSKELDVESSYYTTDSWTLYKGCE